MERVFELFPRLKERERQKARDAVRRRAADAGDRPRADGPPEAAPARRALDGPRADPRGAIFETIAEINSQGTTILLVEQNATHRARAPRPGATCSAPGTVALADTSDALQRKNPRSRRPTWAHDRRLRTPRGQGPLSAVRLARRRRSSPSGSRTGRATARSRAWPPGCCSARSAIVIWLVWPARRTRAGRSTGRSPKRRTKAARYAAAKRAANPAETPRRGPAGRRRRSEFRRKRSHPGPHSGPRVGRLSAQRLSAERSASSSSAWRKAVAELRRARRNRRSGPR